MFKDHRGFALLELLIVVAILGILTLLALPRMESAMVRRDLAGARSSLSTLVLQAKAVAVQRRRPVTMAVDSSKAWLTVPAGGGSSELVAVLNLGPLFGVRMASSAASITVQPTGLVASGTPFMVQLIKAGRMDSLRITGFGRVE